MKLQHRREYVILKEDVLIRMFRILSSTTQDLEKL